MLSRYGKDWPLRCPSCDATEGAMVAYVGPAPFLMKTVKGDMEVVTDAMLFGGGTIGECPVCAEEAPLIDWIVSRGIGDRPVWREPEAEQELGGKRNWFDDGQGVEHPPE
jgi:hypothetical protein